MIIHCINRRVLIIILTFIVGNCFAQKPPQYYKFPPADSITSEGLNSIRPFLDQKRILLVGETSHGGHEFFSIKLKLIKYLAEELDYKHFVFEENAGVCEMFNEYIWGETDQPIEEIIKKSYYTWPYHTQEFAQVLEWVRAFNATKAPEDKVRFWGNDMQVVYNSLFTSLQAVNDSLGGGFPNPVVPRKDHFTYNLDTQTLDSVERLLKEHGDKITKEAQYLHAVELARMKKKYTELQLAGLKEASSRFRDSCMAENVEWILAQLEHDDKLMVWGHNAHIIKSFDTALWKAPMGAFLSLKFPNQVYSIGFDYNYGELLLNNRGQGFMAIAIKPREEQYLARWLDEVDYDVLFIPSSEDNKTFFDRDMNVRHEFQLKNGRYAQLFDAVFFIREVTATTRVE